MNCDNDLIDNGGVSQFQFGQIMCLPRRSGITQLTDDELLLFDFMFDTLLERRFLERDVYSFHMNVPYSHKLDSEQLRETLLRLAAQGLVAATTQGNVLRWSLTHLGGSQWELERKPCWDAYISGASERTLRTGRNAIMVLSPNQATAEMFWDIGLETRLWRVGSEQRRYWRIHNHRLIPWRDFSAIHVLAARDSSYCDETDWEAYDAKRTWWRNIRELDSLLRRAS
jgi:hypothetical protein